MCVHDRKGLDMRGQNDIFDRFVARPWMKRLRPYYIRYKEMWLYALVGVGTVGINVGIYTIFTEAAHVGVLYANAVAWVFATLFAFFSNRTWVFRSHATGVRAFWIQLGSFCFGRLLTLLLEEGMLLLFVLRLGLPNMPVKAVAQVTVIASNYIISKLIVFRRKK